MTGRPDARQGAGRPRAGNGEAWRDPSLPAGQRVSDLLARMTLEEKMAQLASVWVGAGHDEGDGGAGIAPMQDEFGGRPRPLAELIRHGMGQLTRVLGTRPVPPAVGMSTLARLQGEIVTASRFGIPAIAHEECLTGLAAWTATIFPAPLAWGASFDPDLVRDMAAAIGASMRLVGVHQGLAPVLDVVRDARWGRVEEAIGEDPYLVGSIGAAYVRGLQSAGVHATLKHFAGYSASRAGRNMAPVAIGRREFADTMLVPFEMALRLGGAKAVMPSYTDVDTVPVTADRDLLTGTLRDELGFDGVVVSDYFAISFLQTEHGVAGTAAEAGALALDAGVDVELPAVRCYGPGLAAAVRDGRVPAALVDRAAARVLRQKCELGMLDPGWTAQPGGAGADGQRAVDLDPPGHRALARRLAEESVVLLANRGGALPLRADARIAVIGPLAADPLAFFGCYSMPRHLGARFPETAADPAVTPLLDALRAELPGAAICHAPGCRVAGGDRAGFAAAAELARSADVVVAALGDQSGMFGGGTSGEGCDATELRLPGVQGDLLELLAATGTPVVLVLVTGRPYAIGEVAGRLAAAVQAFFPGEEGGTAIAGVLSGRVVPSGRLPVEMPRLPAGQPASYLRPRLAGDHRGSAVDPSPLFAFGHGLSYTTFGYADLAIVPALPAPPAGVPDGSGPAPESAPGPACVPVDGAVEVACTVRNTGARPGAEVVQLYLSDPMAQVVRPARWLAGFARVHLEPGQARRVVFRLHADRTAFHGVAGTRVVEPGEIAVAVGGASDRLPLRGSFILRGAERAVGPDRVLDTPVAIRDVAGAG
jgi:beta-xylosidase